jgi:predicted KAP-like P-loop ATPase
MSIRNALSTLSSDPPGDLAAAFDMADRMSPLLANSSAINGNPRIIKRVLNTVRIRAKLAKLRRVSVEETLIAKLALFERCMGEVASIHLYSAIQAATDGCPEFIKEMEAAKSGKLSTVSPTAWQDGEHQRFLAEWIGLEPQLTNHDLRPTLQLSRDTVALVGRRRGLSEVAAEALKILSAAGAANSPAGIDQAKIVPSEERQDVMDALISELRSHSDWDKRPAKWPGALLFATQYAACAPALRAFVLQATRGNIPPWLRATLAADGPLAEGGK